MLQHVNCESLFLIESVTNGQNHGCYLQLVFTVDGYVRMNLFRKLQPSVWSIVPSSINLQQCLLSSCFSITRSKLGRSAVEISKIQGIPEPPATTIYHCRRDIKIQPKKMMLVANLVNRMPIEEAIAQCQFSPKGAAEVVKEVLEEAQTIAVTKYGVEDKTNLYIQSSHVGRGQHLKRIKYHGRGRFGRMQRYYCHYFCILKEGVPLGKNIPRSRSRFLTDLEKKLKHPKTIKNSLAWW